MASSSGNAFRNGCVVNNCRSYHQKRNGEKKNYIRITAGPQRWRYVHQLVAEAMLGRKLRLGEVVDHKDGNGLNNHPENLRVFISQADHMAVERNGGRVPAGVEVVLDGEEWWNASDKELPS